MQEAGGRQTLIRLSPLILPVAALFAGGLFLTVAQSLGYLLPFEYHGGIFDAYRELLRPYILSSFGISLYVGLVSASLSITLGSILAYGVWRLPCALQKLALVYKVPLILPHIAVGFIVLVFWSKSGVVASLCHSLGLIDSAGEFPAVLFSGSGLGMVIAYVLKSTPFVILLAYGVLKRLDPRLVQTAKMYGASEAYAFRRIVLPHLAPVLHVSFIILFLFAFGAFDIPFLLGESKPEMLSIKVYNLYFRRDMVNRPVAMAILVLMFAFSAFFIAVYSKIAAKLESGERKL